MIGFTQSKPISRAVFCSYLKHKGCITWLVIYCKNQKAPGHYVLNQSVKNLDFSLAVRIEKFNLVCH